MKYTARFSLARYLLSPYVIGLIALLAISFISSYHILVEPGIPAYGDFFVTYKPSRLIRATYPLWNIYGSYPTIEQLPRLGYRYILYRLVLLFFGDNPEPYFKALFLGTFLLAGISAYLSLILLAWLRKDVVRHRWVVVISSLIAAIFYMFNPWAVQRVHQQGFFLGYALQPIVLLASYRLVKNPSLPWALVLALLLSLSASSPHSLVFNTSLATTLLIFHLVLVRPSRWKNTLVYYIIAFVVFLALSAYWVIPIAYEALYGELSIGYMVSNEVLQLLSRNSFFDKVFLLVSNWFIRAPYTPTNGGVSLWIIAAIGVLAVTFLWIFHYDRIGLYERHLLLYIFTIYAICVGLATGVKGFPQIYYALISLPSGWVLRDPNKILYMVILAQSIMIFYSLLYTFEQLRKRRLVFILAIVAVATSLLIYSGPSTYNFFYKVYEPSPIPDDIIKAYNFLARRGIGYEKALYISPAYPLNIRMLDWGKITIADTLSSPLPSFSQFTPYSNFLLAYVFNLIVSKHGMDIGSILAPLGVKYIVFHNLTTIQWYYPIFPGQNNVQEGMRKAALITKALSSSKSLVKCMSHRSVQVFCNKENINSSQEVVLYSGIVATDLGLDSLILAQRIFPDKAIVLLDQLPLWAKMDNLDAYIVHDDLLPLLANYLLHGKCSNCVWLAPAKETRIHKLFAKAWSAAYSSDPLSGEWHQGPLRVLGIANWQYDYDKGIAFSYMKGSRLDIGFKLSQGGDYYVLLRVFKNFKGGVLELAIDRAKRIHINTMSHVNEFKWILLGPFNLKEGMHNISLTNMGGFNAINIIGVVPRKEYRHVQLVAAKLLEDRLLVYLFPAGMLPSISGGIKYENKLLFYNESSVSLTISSLYPLNCRVGVIGKGVFRIEVNGSSHAIASLGDRLVFTPAFRLGKGFEEIKLHAVATSTEGYDLRGRLLAGTIIDTRNGLIMSSARLIVRPGDYLLYIKLRASNTVPINASIKALNSSIAYIEKCRSVGATSCVALVRIRGKDSEVPIYISLTAKGLRPSTGIWLEKAVLLPLEELNSLDAVFLICSKGLDPLTFLSRDRGISAGRIASVKSFENGNKWMIKLSSTRPSILVLRESYASTWRAYIFNDSGLIKVEKPIPIYGALNGFYIPPGRELQVMLVFEPQSKASLGLKISLLSLILVLITLPAHYVTYRRMKQYTLMPG